MIPTLERSLHEAPLLFITAFVVLGTLLIYGLAVVAILVKGGRP